MSQNVSDNIQGKVSDKKARGVAFDVGVLTGFRLGIISGLIDFLFFFWGSENAFSVLLKSLLLLAVIGGWLVIPVLGGVFAAKKTGRGARIGAYSGLFLGPITVFLTVITAFIMIVVFDKFVPSAWSSAFFGENGGAGAELFALGVVPVLVIFAFPASFVLGPLLGALGGGGYRSFADKRRPQQ